MDPVSETEKKALASLCVEYGVQKLEIFGSATTAEFDPERSDLDFLVEFEPSSPLVHGQRYLKLLAALQDLFERKIDLVELGALRNPYFIEEIQETRKLIYAA